MTTQQKATITDNQVVITIRYEDGDELVHTEANGYRCDDPTCPCHADDQVEAPALATHERIMRSALNGDRSFHLMR